MAFWHSSDKIAHNITSGDEMSLQQQELNSVIPDLREIPLERLAELGDSVLAHSIALYRQRVQETGVPLSSFNSSI
jgi:FXSXX-COOH protein